MNRAVVAVLLASSVSGAAIYYAHHNQVSERERMHQGVLRDIEREKYLESLKSGESVVEDCSSGICELSTKRIRQSTPIS